MSLPSFLPGQGTLGLVSIIIPTYNRQHLVGASIESALAQTYTDFEAIVVDDGSTDDTRSEVSRYRDPRVRYFHKENGGLSSARNAGLSHASGEFIAFLDSDDLWLPWKLAAQVALFRRHADVGMTWSDMSTFRRPGEIVHERFLRTCYEVYQQIRIEDVFTRAGTVRDLTPQAPRAVLDCPYYVGHIGNEMFLGNFVHPPTAIVRRERLQKSGVFEPGVTGNGAEDYHFYYRVCQEGSVALLDAPTILYRMHETQMSRQYALHEARADMRLVTHWLSRRPPSLPPARIRERVAFTHRWVGYEELRSGDRRLAIKHLWQSLLMDPARPQVAMMFVLSFFPRGTVAVAQAVKKQLASMRAGMILRFMGLSGLLYLLLRLLISFEPEFADV